MSIFVALEVLFIAHTYLVQKDMIILVIKNHLQAQQQTQLIQYFGDMSDPTFIVTVDGKVTFSNNAALALY